MTSLRACATTATTAPLYGSWGRPSPSTVLPRGLHENHRRRLCGRGVRRQCLATHDLKGLHHTSLGQTSTPGENCLNGHLPPPDIHQPRAPLGIHRAVHRRRGRARRHHERAGARNGAPYVLAGSIRDDGPLPGVYGNAYEAQWTLCATTFAAPPPSFHGHHVAHHRHGEHDPSLPRVLLADGTIRPVYLLRGHRRIRRECWWIVAASPAAASSPTFRTSSPTSPKRLGAFGLEGATSGKVIP